MELLRYRIYYKCFKNDTEFDGRTDEKLWKFYITYDERNIRSLSMSGHNGDGGLFDGKATLFVQYVSGK